MTEAGESSDPTAQARDLPLDSHLHTNLSPDSRVPVDAYAAQALERGIAEICITDHVDFEPARRLTTSSPSRFASGPSARLPSVGHLEASRSGSGPRSRTTRGMRRRSGAISGIMPTTS